MRQQMNSFTILEEQNEVVDEFLYNIKEQNEVEFLYNIKRQNEVV